MDLFLRTQERVRNSRGKRAIRVRATEVLLYNLYFFHLFQLPPGGDLWSCFVDFETKRMDMWEKIVPAFKYNKEVPFFEMLVPTVDTVRFGYLLEKLLAVRYPVLYTGGTGVGKVGVTVLDFFHVTL